MVNKNHNWYKHGYAKHPLYQRWKGMRTRCSPKKNASSQYHGDRGIRVCKEWQDFPTFLKWALKAGYSPELTIERIDNNGNYEPNNCRWASPAEQTRNTRRNVFYTLNNVSKILPEWCRQYKIDRLLVRDRMRRGLSLEVALTSPKMHSYGFIGRNKKS